MRSPSSLTIGICWLSTLVLQHLSLSKPTSPIWVVDADGVLQSDLGRIAHSLSDVHSELRTDKQAIQFCVSRYGYLQSVLWWALFGDICFIAFLLFRLLRAARNHTPAQAVGPLPIDCVTEARFDCEIRADSETSSVTSLRTKGLFGLLIDVRKVVLSCLLNSCRLSLLEYRFGEIGSE